MSKQVKFDSNVTSILLKEAVEEHGYAIVENLIEQDFLKELYDEIAYHGANVRPKDKSQFLGSNTIRFGRLLWRIPRMASIVKHPVIIGLLDEVLLQYSPAYHLSFTGVMQVKEGQKAQILHRDNTIFTNTPDTPINLIGTMLAVDEFKKENGATVLVPGSHKWYEDRQPKREELVFAEMSPGSILFYAGNLIHGAGKCVKGQRTGVSLQYNLSWMSQEEPQFLATPLEFAKNHFDEDVLKLIGYDTISRNCGEIDSEHLLDFLLQDKKQRGLTTPENSYTNGKCKSLFFTSGQVRQHDCFYDVKIDDLE